MPRFLVLLWLCSRIGTICSAGTRLYVSDLFEKFVQRVAALQKLCALVTPDPDTQPVQWSCRATFPNTSYLEIGKQQGALFRRTYRGRSTGQRLLCCAHCICRCQQYVREYLWFSNAIRHTGKLWTSQRLELWFGRVLVSTVRARWIAWNCLGPVMDPFGGYKMSGYGRESGQEHLHEYVQTKSVIVKLA
jgi:aldehyde dehydrogenase (NAD+)